MAAGPSLRLPSARRPADTARPACVCGPNTPSITPAKRGAVWGSWWMYTRWATAPPSAWRSWAAMMLAGSLLAAIADARAWRNWCGWASSPALAARWAKARLAWLGLTGVPRSVRKTRSSSTWWGVGIEGLPSVGRCIAFGLDLCESPVALVRPADLWTAEALGVGGKSARRWQVMALASHQASMLASS